MDSTAENEIATLPPSGRQGEPEAPAQDQVLALTFTGSGKEYFRIWIVNLLLTIATLGIYSAWAKVRRLQYFYRNTQLAGASFDFHGDPKAILKGRLLAVALLVAYHYAFGFSLVVGAVITATLLAGLPFLNRAALRFRLSNTSYRGLAFSFRGSIGGAYLAYLPPVATVLLPGALVSLTRDPRWAGIAVLLYLAWPAMHAAMRRYQHSNLQYGDQPAQYEVGASRFYRAYFMALLIGLGLLLAALIAAFAAGMAISLGLKVAGTLKKANDIGAVLGVICVVVAAYIVFLAGGPYMQVRINNLAWSNTSFPAVRIKSAMTARGMLKLQVANALLTVLTLGLYRPFAAVRVYRYRAAHLSLEVDGQFEDALATAAPKQASAAGDGAADFLGVDISW